MSSWLYYWGPLHLLLGPGSHSEPGQISEELHHLSLVTDHTFEENCSFLKGLPPVCRGWEHADQKDEMIWTRYLREHKAVVSKHWLKIQISFSYLEPSIPGQPASTEAPVRRISVWEGLPPPRGRLEATEALLPLGSSYGNSRQPGCGECYSADFHLLRSTNESTSFLVWSGSASGTNGSQRAPSRPIATGCIWPQVLKNANLLLLGSWWYHLCVERPTLSLWQASNQ